MAMRKINSGDRFGKLVVLDSWWQEVNYPSGTRNILYCKCRCDCGNEKIIRSRELLRGQKSCGCMQGNWKHEDLIGQKFNKLTVIDRDYKKGNNYYWKCKCDCGNTTEVRVYDLVHNKIKSCGHCGKDSREREHRIPPKFMREYHNMCNTRFYRIYQGIKTRCYNTTSDNYYCYGGRGIKMYDRWFYSFENFKEDMYESYCNHVEEYGEDNTTIDRIDVDGNYCKENCRWATRSEQQRNKRRDVNE